MIPLLGIASELPYKELKLVGILLFEAYPSTIVFKNEENNIIIKEWVDCSDDNIVNRYFYYSVDRIFLKHFIDGRISHLELIKNSTESYVYFQDEKKDEVSNSLLVSLKSIHNDYLPTDDAMFNVDYGVDTDDIIRNFDLNIVEELEEVIPTQVKRISREVNSETLYIHLSKGKGVGNGTIKTEVFGKTLLSIDKLYKNVALDHLKKKDRPDYQLDAKKNKDFLDYTETEVFGVAIRASFGFMIRPVLSQIHMFPNTPAYLIAEKTFNLINNSKDKEGLKQEYDKHSIYTLKTYEEFLSEVYKQEINIDLNWYNPIDKKQIRADLRYVEANNIVQEVKKLFIANREVGKVQNTF